MPSEGYVGVNDSFTPKVLVVDANVKHCLLYQMEMEALGYEVVCAHDRDEALRQMQRRYFDVAVVDVVFPNANGADFLKEISTNRPNHNGHPLPIIINTAYPYAKNHIKRLAADAFVLKSSDLKELLGKIHLLSNHVRKIGAHAPATYRRN